ncbi:MAG: hypothetical protein DRH90_14195, partial [Deltaproteobacteria bacterium]
MNHFDGFGFDIVLNRKGTNSYKWDNAEVLNENLLPLSVADMDFAVPSEVTQALVNRTANPVYGYEFQPDALKEAIIAWEYKRHGFKVRKDWLLFTPGVVNGLAISILSFTEKGDRIVVQPPVYPPPPPPLFFLPFLFNQNHTFLPLSLSLSPPLPLHTLTLFPI